MPEEPCEKTCGENCETCNSPPQAPPAGSNKMEQIIQEQELRARMDRIGKKLLVLSGKGGVGKSTVAANLAVALARAGKKVGLLDVDIHGPSIPQLLGLSGRGVGLENDRIAPVEVNENLSVMSIGFLLTGPDQPVIWRGPRKFGVIRQFLADVSWGRLDYLVVDSPPGTGDEPLSVAQLVGAPAGAILVTTPQDLAIADVRRCLSFCVALSVPVVGIVENMSSMVCPHCGREIEMFPTGGGEALAKEVGTELLGQIPVDSTIAASGDLGVPFAGQANDTPAGRAFDTIVRRILASDGQGTPESQASSEQKKETDGMKIAIPLVQGHLSLHFGHCEQFALVEVDGDKQIVGQTLLTPPAHEPGVLPAWLHEQGASIILASGMGQRAQQLFKQNGIDVVIGAPPETPEALVKAWVNGSLATGDNICDH